MATDPDDLAALLPLPSATFHILLALADRERHGYGIIQDVAARTRGALRLSPGTLYRTIQRLLEYGWIWEPKQPLVPSTDPRRRTYHITPLGTAVARAEAQRLKQLVRLARVAGLLAPEPS